MGPRATVILGLASGAVTALVILVAAVLLLPGPAASQASPSPGTASSPSPAARASGAEPSGTAIASGTLVGGNAPPLSIPQVGGGRIDLATLRGHPVWLDFMETTCDSCRAELTAMSDFAERYGDAGLVVIAVDVREGEPIVAAFAQSLNVRFPVGLDADGGARTAWGVRSIPTHIWIDRDGVVRAEARGSLTKEAMADDLAKILPAVKVTAS